MTEVEIVYEEIRRELFELKDQAYADFHSKLIPTVDRRKIIGVRTPVLRKYAKSLSDEVSKTFLDCLPHEYYDEDNLHAFLLERIADYDECVTRLNSFLPFVDNWATCDMMSPKVLGKNIEKLKIDALSWMNGRSVYEIRFGIKIFMDFFSEEYFSEDIALAVAAVRSNEYYVNMAAAWYFATLLAKQPNCALSIFENKTLPVWTHNKAISKASESYRIPNETKSLLKKLKIKE